MRRLHDLVLLQCPTSCGEQIQTQVTALFVRNSGRCRGLLLILSLLID
jgi:hypothetical protein